MGSDDELLRRYTRSGGDDADRAFRLLVDRYAGLVFSIAWRRVGERELAEEVAQNVFAVLARKAAFLKVEAGLAGWLHRVTMLESAKALRTEYRRKRKLEALESMETAKRQGVPDDWGEVMPLLDEALLRLSAKERDLVLQHYVEERSYAEIARDTGRSKAACAKQCSRAVAKLCGLLRRQGVTVSAAALGVGISQHFAKAAPAGLAQSLSHSVLTAATAATHQSIALTIFTTIMTTTKFTTAAALVAAGAALPLSLHWADMKRDVVRLDRMLDSGEAVLTTAAVDSGGGGVAGVTGLSTSPERRVGVDLQLLERELKKLPFPDKEIKRKLDLERLMFELREDEVPAVAALIQSLEPDALGDVTVALFARWAEFDPQTAASMAEELESKALVAYAREGLMVTWAASDPAAALAYLASHPKGDQASSMVWATVGDMVDRDPLEALAWVDKAIDEAGVSDNVRRIILEAWGEADPEAAMAWAGQQEEIEARAFSKAIIERLASSEPEKAFQLALDSEHPAIRAGSARWTLMQWMGHDPMAAVERFASMPPEFYEDDQMMWLSVFFAEKVTKRDPAKSLALADELPQGRVRDRWLYGVAWEMASQEPVEAAALAEELPPSGHRRRALDHIGKEWLKSDAEAARAWIENSGLFGEKKREQLLKAGASSTASGAQ